MRWDVDSRNYAAKTVWCSKSIAEQRKGRTGRTCRGRVFRLVHQGYYIQNLLQWDVPQLTMSACHNEVLAMVCAHDKLSIDDPRKLFAKCLDPPTSEVVDNAIDFLVEIDACQKVKSVFDFMNRGAAEKISPTDYGTLLSSLSMSVAEARIVLEGGKLGLLHEILAFMAIYNHRPSPIVHIFGDAEKNQEILQSFYDDVEPSSQPSVAIANFSAYIYWDVHWNQQRNRQSVDMFRYVTHSEQFSNGNGDLRSRDTWKWTGETELEHIEWCKNNDVNPTSMRSVSDIIETTMNVLFLSKHEPEWLRCADPTPRWKRRSELETQSLFGREMLPIVYGDKMAPKLCDVLTKLVSSKSALASRSLAEAFLGVPASRTNAVLRNRSNANVPIACVHFLAGTCKFNESCRHSHSRHARRPPCRFFLSGRCSKGDACIYSHDDPDADVTISGSNFGPTDPLVPVLESLHLSGGALGWFKSISNRLFLLGEGNFQFTRALTSMGKPPLVSSSNVPSSETSPGALICVDATMLHLNPKVTHRVGMMRDLAFAWNFPFTGTEEDAMEHEALILQAFQSLYILFEQHGSSKISLGISLQGDQFSRWNVTRSAWRTGWNLTGWSDFDHKAFPGYHPCRQNGETFPVESAKLYVFEVKKRFS